MRTCLALILGTALLAVGIFIGGAPPSERANPPAARAATVAGSQANTPAPKQHSDVLENIRIRENDGLVKVARVVDGDTIDVEINGKMERVRYIGIDTPETVDPRKTVQCFGVEASKKNKELVEGKIVRLEKDVTERDRYSRLLRYIWLDDTLINQELVAQGFAKSYSYPPDIKYQDKFVAAEKKARENKLGLWAACASVTAPLSLPSEQHTNILQNVGMLNTQESMENFCTIKGNINAAGEKIYHGQGCGSYAKTAIDAKRGERWFCSEAEAKAAGWRRALNCP